MDQKIDSAHIPPHHVRSLVGVNLQQQFPILCAQEEASLLASLISALVTAVETLGDEMSFQLRIALHAVGVATDLVNGIGLRFFPSGLKVVVGFALFLAYREIVQGLVLQARHAESERLG
jgi:hypothetical protein